MSELLDTTYLRSVMTLCKEFNVKKVDLSGVSLEFGPHLDVLRPEALTKLTGEDTPSEDEMLYWSVPNVDFPVKSEPPNEAS